MTQHRSIDTNNLPPNLVATASRHDLAFWDLHPDVLGVVDVPLQGDPNGIQVSMWLSLPAEEPLTPRRYTGGPPARPADIEIGGDGLADHQFWGRLPEVEYFELFQEHMCDPPLFPYGWWQALIWIRK